MSRVAGARQDPHIRLWPGNGRLGPVAVGQQGDKRGLRPVLGGGPSLCGHSQQLPGEKKMG